MNRARLALFVGAVWLHAGAGRAQTTVDGSAEVSVARSTTQAADQKNQNNSVGQNYSLGWQSTLFDPRVFRYNVQGTFRTSNLSAETTGLDSQNGRAGDLGYKVGATLLPASAMPFSFQMSRVRSTSAGDLALSNPIRSGLFAASGIPAADFESLNRELNLDWHVNVERFPQVELGYRRSQSEIAGGNYRATQSDRDLSASVLKNTASTHQTFRYQATQSENVLEQTFSQKLGLLDYDFGATLTARTRLTVHAGQRNAFARSVFVTPVDAATGAYAPVSSTGASTAQYGQIGYNYEPTSRFSFRVLGNADRQSGDTASTAALLGSISAHAELLPGLIATTTGTAGQRQQVVGNSPVTVATRSADAGLAYQANSRYMSGGMGATRGLGINATPDGRRGSTDSWSGETHLSTTVGWFGSSAGYDRELYRDEILEFGNYEAERIRVSAQAQAKRGSFTTSAEQLDITRGRAATFIHNLQRTLSSTASFRLIGQNFVSATAGHFGNDFDGAAGAGRDNSLFWSVGINGSIKQDLRLSGWLRSEIASASRTQFNQDALSAFARLEYRLRTLNFALEYRRSHSRMLYPGMMGPDAFAGQQIRFSVIRQFGFRVR
ncbi:MAG: hypothetical protein ABMA15_04145 [Vicinamibacterales bacterium]